MSAAAELAPDAAMALGIAATAMPFTRTRQAAVEHWLRVLRLRGTAGAALQSVGVGEQRLQAASADADVSREATATGGDLDDPVAAVAERASRIASRRAEEAITTVDLLLAVIDVYGPDCDRVLMMHGTDRSELLQRLGEGQAPAGSDEA